MYIPSPAESAELKGSRSEEEINSAYVRGGESISNIEEKKKTKQNKKKEHSAKKNKEYFKEE